MTYAGDELYGDDITSGPSPEPPDVDEDRGGGWCDDCGGPLEEGESTENCPHCAAFGDHVDRLIDERRERKRFGEEW